MECKVERKEYGSKVKGGLRTQEVKNKNKQGRTAEGKEQSSKEIGRKERSS